MERNNISMKLENSDYFFDDGHVACDSIWEWQPYCHKLNVNFKMKTWQSQTALKSAESWNRNYAEKLKNQSHETRLIFLVFSKLKKLGNVRILTVSFFKTAFWLVDGIFIAFSVWFFDNVIVAFSHLIFFAVSNISPDTWGGQYVEIPCSLSLIYLN